MENWLIEVVKILAGAILGVLFAEYVPAIKSFFKKSSLSIRNRNIEYYKDEYKRIKQYKENHATLAVELLRLLAKRLSFTILFFTFVFVGLFSELKGNPSYISDNATVILGVFGGVISSEFRNLHRLIENVVNLEEYKEKNK